MTAADDIIAASVRDGGGTFYDDGTPWQDAHRASMAVHRAGQLREPHAYAVAVASVAVLPQPRQDRLYDAVEHAVRVAAAPGSMGHYIGTWRDADGTWYVDLVRVIYSRSHAVKLGRRYAQLAIYDLTAGAEVRL